MFAAPLPVLPLVPSSTGHPFPRWERLTRFVAQRRASVCGYGALVATTLHLSRVPRTGVVRRVGDRSTEATRTCPRAGRRDEGRSRWSLRGVSAQALWGCALGDEQGWGRFRELSRRCVTRLGGCRSETSGHVPRSLPPRVLGRAVGRGAGGKGRAPSFK